MMLRAKLPGGDLPIDGAEAHLDAYPRDALVLSLLLGAFGLYAFSGRADHDAAKLAICARNATHYGEDWWFISYLGWSHTEAGNLREGRALSERAMALLARFGLGERWSRVQGAGLLTAAAAIVLVTVS